MLNFEKLIVWTKAMDYCEQLVRLADSLPTKYQYSFSDQQRRAALSVPSNIAEGVGRATSKDRVYFYSISKGSVYETVNIFKLLERLKIANIEADFTKLGLLAEEICRMLYALTKNS